jgi:hypothetical protein
MKFGRTREEAVEAARECSAANNKRNSELAKNSVMRGKEIEWTVRARIPCACAAGSTMTFKTTMRAAGSKDERSEARESPPPSPRFARTVL